MAAVTDLLTARSRSAGARRALVDVGAGFFASWFDLDGLATSWARQLQRLGVRPGQRVAVAEPAGVRFAAILHACLRGGFAMVPLPMRGPEVERERILADCRPKALIKAGEARLLDGASAGAEGDAVVIYTSGTTGAPKGVRLSAANLVASAEGCQESLGSTSGDRWLLCLQPHHVGGLGILVRSGVCDQPVVTLHRFEEALVLEAIAREQVTLVSLVPTMLIRLLEAGGAEALRSVRAILLGGAPAPADLVRDWARQGLRVCPSYGLSETASQVATVPPGRADELAGGAGFPHSRAGIELVEGEIVVTGPVVSPGYVNPELPRQPSGGRFATGDAGFIDERGALVVTGRLDDAIITGGENVQPEEVEAVLRAHPAVRDAAVAGLPDPTWGAVLQAYVVADGVEAEELIAFARERLSGFKVPRRVRFVADLPRTEAGKLLRRKLQRC